MQDFGVGESGPPVHSDTTHPEAQAMRAVRRKGAMSSRSIRRVRRMKRRAKRCHTKSHRMLMHTPVMTMVWMLPPKRTIVNTVANWSTT